MRARDWLISLSTVVGLFLLSYLAGRFVPLP